MNLGKIGMVREIDSLGRVVIPAEMRTALKLEPSAQVEIFMTDDYAILLRPTSHHCAICGQATEHIELEQFICDDCLSKLSKKSK